jgi:hypothetical protein
VGSARGADAEVSGGDRGARRHVRDGLEEHLTEADRIAPQAGRFPFQLCLSCHMTAFATSAIAFAAILSNHD